VPEWGIHRIVTGKSKIRFESLAGCIHRVWMSLDRYVVIMAGGRGERFWPQSRLARPKHLLPIVGEKPMLTQTVERLGSVVPPERVLIITNAEQAAAVREVCPMLPPENVVAEPVGRDTAAAVGLATLLVKHRDPKAAFAMLPADHVIHDSTGFQRTLEAAFAAAEGSDALVTVGIPPTYPATGYGYVEQGKEIADGVYDVVRFKEKPDLETAKEYVETGRFYWNAGMFFWRVPVIAECFEQFTPGLWEALQAIDTGLAGGEALDGLLSAHYPGLEKISIDFAVMEKAETVRMVPAGFDWDDVGAWPAVARHFPADEAGNVARGDAVMQDASGNIVMAQAGHTVTLIGVKDLIVVQTGDATLVCPIDQAESIKQMVKTLAADGSKGHLL
jgi:mannose-1-phosphate guanylyltransferase